MTTIFRNAILRSLATQVDEPRAPRALNALTAHQRRWRALAIQIRGHMQEGRGVASAAGLVGVVPDKARRILAEWPPPRCA
jgi:hypothetical protein